MKKTIKVFHWNIRLHVLWLIALVCILPLPAEGADKSPDLMKTQEQTRTMQQPTTTQQKQDMSPKQLNRMDVRDRLPGVVCAGVDLIVSKVELQRRSSGIALKASVKNRCSDTCSGDIIISVDERAVGPRGNVITQQIASEVPGETEITMFSWLGVYSRDSVDCTYTVSVRVEGGSRETNTSNNSCRVTLHAGESRKVHRCP